MKNSKAIGIFDSGLGGLTVVKEVIRRLPYEKIIYFGERARVPYGPKSKGTIIRFSIQNILFLLRHKVKLIIIACNTSSSVALHTVRRNFKIPIIGVIEPGVTEAIRRTKNKKVGIIGTKATIKSRVYEKQIRRSAPDIKTFGIACPLFVPLVEEGWFKSTVTSQIVKTYIAPFKARKVDTVVLGCTHYPLLKPVIQEVMGSGVALVDSAKQVAREAKSILEKENLTAGKRKVHSNNVRFYVSDEPEDFVRAGQRFLKVSLHNVKKVFGV